MSFEKAVEIYSKNKEDYKLVFQMYVHNLKSILENDIMKVFYGGGIEQLCVDNICTYTNCLESKEELDEYLEEDDFLEDISIILLKYANCNLKVKERINSIWNKFSDTYKKKILEKISNNVTIIGKLDNFSYFFNSLNADFIINEKELLLECIEKICKIKSNDAFVDEFRQSVLLQLDFFSGNKELYKDISKISMKNIDIDEQKLKDILKFALDNIPYALSDDSYVSSIYQISNSFKESEEINKMFNDYKSKFKMPDMSIYETEINEMVDMDKDKFEKFLLDLKEIKNCKGILPEKYCDYLIKQKIDINSNLNKNLDSYFEQFKRVIEDKAHHILNKYGIENYFISTDMKSDRLRGLAGSKYINLREEEIRNLSSKNIHSIITMFHECRHAFQTHCMHRKFSDKTSINGYKMVKEECIRAVLPKYYKRNYRKMNNEIDARIFGARWTYEYLKELGLENEKLYLGNNISFLDTYMENQRDELTLKYSKDSDIKLLLNDRNYTYRHEAISITLEELLKRIPDFREESFINYPIISMEYDENGNRKSSFEILKDYEDELNEVRNSRDEVEYDRLGILALILKQKMILPMEKLVEYSEELLKYKTDDNTVKKFRNHIIKDEILYSINKHNGKIDIPDKFVENLRKFIELNPKENINNDILSSIEDIENKRKKSDEEILLDDIFGL